MYRCVKRLFDILFSLVILLILGLPMLIIGLIIKIESKGKVIYKQKRIGKNGKYIHIYKFRSMYNNADKLLKELLEKDPEIREEYYANFKLQQDPRITKVGKFIRKTSLDELPQLINIIKGDLSIIGPRPVIDGEIEKYKDEEKDKFLSVTPGLTGWWACNGRSATTYEDRKKLELYYVDHFSLKLDVKCFFKTIKEVLFGKGAC